MNGPFQYISWRSFWADESMFYKLHLEIMYDNKEHQKGTTLKALTSWYFYGGGVFWPNTIFCFHVNLNPPNFSVLYKHQQII